MAAKKKGPGVRSAGALKTCVRKKQSKPTKRRALEQSKPWSPRRELWMYSGTRLLATFIVTSAGPTRAFDADRRSLGAYPTFKVATTAVNRAECGGDKKERRAAPEGHLGETRRAANLRLPRRPNSKIELNARRPRRDARGLAPARGAS
jgi:hypothetical protein